MAEVPTFCETGNSGRERENAWFSLFAYFIFFSYFWDRVLCSPGWLLISYKAKIIFHFWSLCLHLLGVGLIGYTTMTGFIHCWVSNSGHSTCEERTVPFYAYPWLLSVLSRSLTYGMVAAHISGHFLPFVNTLWKHLCRHTQTYRLFQTFLNPVKVITKSNY